MTDYRAEARRAAGRHPPVPPGMFSKQIERESGFRPDVRSPAGALGIAQFMPATAAWLGVDPMDPIASLDAAAKYMARLYGQFGRWSLALAAYNAGEGNVHRYQGVPPFSETRAYLDYILGPGWPEPTTETPVPTDRLTTTDDANFRAGPGISKPKLTDPLKKGSPVWPTGAPTVAAEGHVWRQVALGPVGWIAEELLKTEDAKTNGEPPPAPSPFFNPDYPVSTQEHDWDCAQDSTWWALRALGRKPSNQWMENMMLAAGVESTEVGLTDASGRKLAAWITEQYQSEITAYAIPDATFAQITHLAGTTAILCGGHNWAGPNKGHWVAVRRYRDGVLELANPGGQFSQHYGEQSLDRAAWDAKAPWSAVVIERKA